METAELRPWDLRNGIWEWGCRVDDSGDGGGGNDGIVFGRGKLFLYGLIRCVRNLINDS